MSNIILDIKNIDVYYGGIHALHDVSLHVNEGEIVSIIGSNGAGKSTLMRTVVGEKKFSSGEISFNGRPLAKHEHEVVKNGISLVPEGRRIFSGLTVKENLIVGTYPRYKDKVGVAQDLEEVLELFPRLKERLHQMAGTLSGGEQQMLAVGRALMSHPKLLCLDEPSLGLAPIVINEMFQKILQINEERKQTILLVEQNAFLALHVAHRAYVMKTGSIVMEGSGAELLKDPSVQESYLGISSSK